MWIIAFIYQFLSCSAVNEPIREQIKTFTYLLSFILVSGLWQSERRNSHMGSQERIVSKWNEVNICWRSCFIFTGKSLSAPKCWKLVVFKLACTCYILLQPPFRLLIYLCRAYCDYTVVTSSLRRYMRVSVLGSCRLGNRRSSSYECQSCTSTQVDLSTLRERAELEVLKSSHIISEPFKTAWLFGRRKCEGHGNLGKTSIKCIRT